MNMMDGSARSTRDEEGDEVLEIVRANQTRRFSQQQEELLRRFSDPDLGGALRDFDSDGSEEEEGSAAAKDGTEEESLEETTAAKATKGEEEEPIKSEEDPTSIVNEHKEGSVKRALDSSSTEAADMPSKTHCTSTAKPAEMLTASTRPPVASDSMGEGLTAAPPLASEASSAGPGAYSIFRGESLRTLTLEDAGSISGSTLSGDLEEGSYAATASGNPDVHLVEAQLVDPGREDDQNSVIVQANAVPESKWIWRCTVFGRDLSINTLLPICAVLLIGLIVSLVMLISASRSSSSSADTSTTPPQSSASSDSLPAAVGTNQTRLESLRSFLISSSVTTEDNLFEDPATPQYQALQWLAYQDPEQMSPKQGNRLIQRYVLAVLYYSTGGEESWLDSMNFLSGEHECEWNYINENGDVKGVVECNSYWDQGITNLNVWWHNLTGTLPNELGALTELRTLNLLINELEGTIPSSLAQLSDLESLFLNDNRFEGTVPSQLRNLPYLSTFTVYANEDVTGDLSSFCPKEGAQLVWFVSDCVDGGKVDCPCCLYCCDMEASECCAQSPDGNATASEECFDPTPRVEW